MSKYLKAQNKTNEIIIANNFTSNELDRFSASDFRWADNRTKQFQHRQVKKGEIYQFEFGKNYKPEMSYEHRGLVIGVKQKLLYVLPIFSYDSNKHPDVYHPIDNPASKSDLFLVNYHRLKSVACKYRKLSASIATTYPDTASSLYFRRKKVEARQLEDG